MNSGGYVGYICNCNYIYIQFSIYYHVINSSAVLNTYYIKHLSKIQNSNNLMIIIIQLINNQK